MDLHQAEGFHTHWLAPNLSSNSFVEEWLSLSSNSFVEEWRSLSSPASSDMNAANPIISPQCACLMAVVLCLMIAFLEMFTMICIISLETRQF